MTTEPSSAPSTPITLTGPLRHPVQMLAEQTYGGHKSVHDDASAAELGLPGAPIEGPTHFSQFEPLALALWGDRWFTNGCLSAHFQNMVVEGEEVRAQMTIDGVGATVARIDAFKADGTPVLTGTASVGPTHPVTDLDERMAKALTRLPENLFIIDQLSIGQRSSGEERVSMDFDTFLGNLYPFTLRQKLEAITEHVTFQQPGAQTPWGASVVPFEMLSVLTHATSKSSSSGSDEFKVRGPSVGLFIDLEVRVIDGPVLVGREYRVEREIVCLGASKRTESYWTRSSLFDGDRQVADVLLHQGVFVASYAGYPSQG